MKAHKNCPTINMKSLTTPNIVITIDIIKITKHNIPMFIVIASFTFLPLRPILYSQAPARAEYRRRESVDGEGFYRLHRVD